MFGLTPRTDASPKKSSQTPHQASSHTTRPKGPSPEEMRLTLELEKVLSKKPKTHRTLEPAQRADVHPETLSPTANPTPSATTPTDRRYEDDGPHGAGFIWLAPDKTEEIELTQASRLRRRWLTRARQQNRWDKVRRGTQWLLLACSACAFVLLMVLPSLT